LIAELLADLLKGRATVTAVMGRLEAPKALEIRRRICEPPIDMCKVCRIVVFGKVRFVRFCRVG
jgi:hypothetical protein